MALEVPMLMRTRILNLRFFWEVNLIFQHDPAMKNQLRFLWLPMGPVEEGR